MHIFDYTFLDKGLLPASLTNITANIYGLRSASGLRRSAHRQIFTELEKVARIQSVKSSNAIEGIITSDERLAAIVNGSSAPLNHDEAEIAGYRDALSSIHTNFQNLDFCEKDILSLHAQLLTPLSKRDLCNLLPDVSLTTVEAVLGRMLKEGRIRRIGQGRATRYIHA